MIKKELFKYDAKIIKENNFKYISGSDEAGRGAMAGPIVVASVILPFNYENIQIRDSKLLSEKTRNNLYNEIINNAISYSIKIYDSKIVDKLNPKATSIKGMIDSINDLSIQPELALIDGEKLNQTSINFLQLIKGDDISQSIAAASILAKVTRDNIMKKYDKKYPGYNLGTNKGYCTLDHQNKVIELGILPIHRLTYAPVKKALKFSNKK